MVDGDWPRFFERVRALGATPREERHAALAATATDAESDDPLAACTGGWANGAPATQPP